MEEIKFYDKVEEHFNCYVEILENTETGEVSVGWKPMDMGNFLAKLDALKCCTNCDHKKVCAEVVRRKASRADNYKPCKAWKAGPVE